MRKRLIKTAVAIAAGQGINVVRQLVLPAAFLAWAGADNYAAWLVLGAGLGQLNLLDFGLQTCAVNRMGMAFHTGDLAAFRRIQSTALWLTLAIVLASAAAAVGVLWLPIESWLKLSLPPEVVRWTMLLLAWAVLAQILFGQLAGVFRAINLAWRGQIWGNILRLGSLVVLVVQLWFRPSIPMLAAGALFFPVAVLMAVLVDLRLQAPHCRPTLLDWNKQEAMDLIRPSLFFSLGILNNFLLFEVPILILQRTGGSESVVTFSVLRTLITTSRQFLTPLQFAIIPEITRVFAIGDKAAMQRLYRFSVELACIGGTLLSLTAGLGSAGIVSIWLHGKVVVAPLLAAVLAATGLAATCRESRYLFQLGANHHERSLAKMTLGYLLMLLVECFLANRFNELGVAVCWLATEFGLVISLASDNFASFRLRDSRATWAVFLLVPVVLLVVWTGLSVMEPWNPALQVLLAGVFAAGMVLVFFHFERERSIGFLQRIWPRLSVPSKA